jgi:hypothetical protein
MAKEQDWVFVYDWAYHALGLNCYVCASTHALHWIYAQIKEQLENKHVYITLERTGPEDLILSQINNSYFGIKV